MRIKKVSGTAVLNGNVVDNLTDNSTENAPSQRAVNEALLKRYSTEEQKIGIWLDGKPIYRKTIVSNCSNLTTNTWITIDSSFTTIDKVIAMNGVVYSSAINSYMSCPVYEGNDYRLNIAYDTTTKVIKGNKGSGFARGDIYITLEYTKTTD